jgi:malonate transporter and related proteins
MWAIFLQTMPFFAIIALGYGAGRTGFFTAEATAYLTKFVFYFALSAMLLRFSANASLGELWDWTFVAAYLAGTALVYAVGMGVALARRQNLAEAAVEAQCCAIGNIGFLGFPMLALLLGEAAIGYIVVMLAVDLIVFSSLIVILITVSREGRLRWGVLRTVGVGLVSNPMILSIGLGLALSGGGVPMPDPVNSFLLLLGAAATQGALFAIGASLATKSAERVAVAGWLSFAKLVLHPGFVAVFALGVFAVEPYAAGVMIASASLPVAGNVYILAQHYGVAPLRVSAAILVSTAASIVTVSAVIAWVTGFMPPL